MLKCIKYIKFLFYLSILLQIQCDMQLDNKSVRGNKEYNLIPGIGINENIKLGQSTPEHIINNMGDDYEIDETLLHDYFIKYKNLGFNFFFNYLDKENKRDLRLNLLVAYKTAKNTNEIIKTDNGILLGDHYNYIFEKYGDPDSESIRYEKGWHGCFYKSLGVSFSLRINKQNVDGIYIYEPIE